MNLVYVDIVSSKTTQRILDLLHDSAAGRIPINHAAAPTTDSANLCPFVSPPSPIVREQRRD